MSDLKHRTIAQLEEARDICHATIGKHQGKINNEQTRLHWINHYMAEKQKVEIHHDNAVYYCTLEDASKVLDQIKQGK